MRRVKMGGRARLLSLLIVMATVIGGQGLDFLAQRTLTEGQTASGGSSTTAGRRVPSRGEQGESESEAIEARASREFRLLAYPTWRIPPEWMSKAQAHVRRAVPDGAAVDFRGAGDPQSGATAPEAVTPLGVQQIDSTSWTSLGPRPGHDKQYGIVTGRVNVLAVHPTNPATVYAGTAAGGLWKTINCCSTSTTWTPLWEDKDFSAQATGAIKIDPTNPEIVYVGTGDSDSDDQFSSGIMKTSDGGASWVLLGEKVFVPYATGTPDVANQNIAALELDPRRTSTMLVGTAGGFFMSYNGGQTWSRYNVHNRLDASQRVTSMLIDGATNPATVYVAVGDPRGGSGNGVYRATIPSSGAPAFTRTTTSWPAGVGRIELAAARGGDGKLTLYAQVHNLSGGNALGTFVTRNGGVSWTRLAGSADTFYKDCRGQLTKENQDSYNLHLGVDPANDKTLYIARTSFYKATVNATYTGFTSLTDLTNVYTPGCPAADLVHPDNHAVAFASADGSRFLLGNDGGVYFNSNRGAANAWTHLNTTQNTLQFYAGQIGPNMTQAPQFAWGGTQDNGMMSWDASQTTQRWQGRGGTDGFYAAFDPIKGGLNSGNWYQGSDPEGALACSSTGLAGTFNDCAGPWKPIDPEAEADRTDFATPFMLDQDHCNTNTGCRNLILGTYRLWATATGGLSYNQWRVAGRPATAADADDPQDLTKGADTGGTIIDVHFAPSNPRAAAVGTDDGNIAWSNSVYAGSSCTQAAANTTTFACSVNTAATWVKFVGGTTPVLPNRAVTRVAFDPTTDQVIYAAVGGFSANTPARPGHVFQGSCSTSCNVATNWRWTNKSGNLPDTPAESIIVNPNNRKQVFLGTYTGFFYTNDITAATVVWQRYMNGLPNTRVRYLTVDRARTTLGAFTYGRSLYAIRLPSAAGFSNCNAFEPNNSATAAPSFSVGGTETHTLCTAGDQDWVKFSATANTQYRIETLNLQGTANDTVLTVFDTDGTTQLDTNDNASTTTKASLVTFTPSTSGTYFVRVTHAAGTGDPSFRYDLRISAAVSCRDPYEATNNNSAAEAEPFTVDTTQQGHAFCAPNDQDWVKFTATANTQYRIETLNLQGTADTYLELYNPDGTTLRDSNDNVSTTKASALLHTIPTAGTYYVKVRNVPATAGDPSAIYDLRISKVATAGCDPFEPDDSPAQARDIFAGAPQTHLFCKNADVDWVKISAAAGTTVDIATSNLAANVDTVLELYAANGTTLIAYNDESGPSGASRVTYVPPAATTLFVKVSNYEAGVFGAANSYSLALSTRATCNNYEPNNTETAPSRIGIEEPQAHAFCVAGDMDWIAFKVTTAGSYTIRTYGLARPQTDTYLWLYTAGGQAQALAEDDEGAGNGASRIQRTLAAGDYLLAVAQYNDAGGATYTYNVVVEPTP